MWVDVSAIPPEETELQALVRMEVACQLALDSLPELPRETGEKLRAPIQALCEVTREELVRLRPSLASRFTTSQ
jgi:hypothetical protein